MRIVTAITAAARAKLASTRAMPYIDDHTPSRPQITPQIATISGATMSPRFRRSVDTSTSGAGPSRRVVNIEGSVIAGPPRRDPLAALGLVLVHRGVVLVLELGEEADRRQHRHADREPRQGAQP